MSRIPMLFVALTALGALAFAACDDGGSSTTTDTTTTTCDVQPTLDSLKTQYFSKSCTLSASCHAPGANPAGGLDLETDPHAAMVGVAAVAAPSKKLIVAGDADNSFLVQKVEGTQGATEMALMPFGAPEPVDPNCSIKALRDWINAGAPAN